MCPRNWLLIAAVACSAIAVLQRASVEAYVIVVPNPPINSVYSQNHTLIPDSDGNFRAVNNSELFNLDATNQKPADENDTDVAPTRRCFCE